MKRQCDHLSGKPGTVREFESCQGSFREKILSGNSDLKLFIVSCIFASILDFAQLVHFILVSDHALLHSYHTTDKNTSTGMIWVTLNMDRSAVNRQGNKCQGILHCLESVSLERAGLFTGQMQCQCSGGKQFLCVYCFTFHRCIYVTFWHIVIYKTTSL